LVVSFSYMNLVDTFEHMLSIHQSIRVVLPSFTFTMSMQSRVRNIRPITASFVHCCPSMVLEAEVYACMEPTDIKFYYKSIQDITLSHGVMHIRGSKVFTSGMSLTES